MILKNESRIIDVHLLKTIRSVVYCILNRINQKKYIGKTINTFWKRYSNGKWWKNTYNNPLLVDVEKYGLENFSIFILEKDCSINEIAKLEADYIDSLNTIYPNGYNLCFRDESGKKARVDLAIKNSLLGKARKAQELAMLGIVKKRRPWNEEERLEISKRTAGPNNPRYGIVMTDSTKEKIRVKAIGRKHSEETRNKLRRPKDCNKVAVLQIDRTSGNIIEEFRAIKEAAKKLSIRPSVISAACSSLQKTAAGFVWRYKDPKPKRVRPKRKPHNNRPIFQFSMDGSLLSEFESAKEAATILKIGVTGLRSACKGIQKTCCGYYWKYKDSYETP